MPKTVLQSLTRNPIVPLLVVAATILGFGSAPTVAGAAGTSTVSGAVFHDTNANGVQDPGESPIANQTLCLQDATGQTQLACTFSDSSGQYHFSALADGTYRVQYDVSDWWALRDNWVPSTTGSAYPRINLSLAGSATANFGWRPITRSPDLSAPLSSYVGSNGLRVNSYDDVVSAKTVYDDLMSGALVGAEASTVTVYFDYSTNSDLTSYGAAGAPGSYTDYNAGVFVAYLPWLDTGDQMLFHEYGHAWSMYNAYIAQQDPTLTGYLQARGVLNDPRLDTSHMWDRREMLAEDYRQLFGTPNAQAMVQNNTDLPPASDVPGLKAYLSGAFMQAALQQSAPANTAVPTISGTPAVGQTLTCGTGAWSGSPTYSYQWTRDGATISGATLQTRAVVNADAGHGLGCTVSATNSAGSASAAAAAVSVPIPPPPPISSLLMSPAPVKVSGTASFGIAAAVAVTVTIVTVKGSLVSTLLSNASESAGTVSATWSRPKSLKTGTYTLKVVAVDVFGQQTATSTGFSVS